MRVLATLRVEVPALLAERLPTGPRAQVLTLDVVPGVAVRVVVIIRIVVNENRTAITTPNGTASQDRIERIDKALARMAERRAKTAARLREAAAELRRAS